MRIDVLGVGFDNLTMQRPWSGGWSWSAVRAPTMW